MTGKTAGLLKEIPYGVEVTSRENEKAVYRIVQNFNCNRIEIEFPKDGFEVWQGSYDGTIAGFGTVILRKQKQQTHTKKSDIMKK